MVSIMGGILREQYSIHSQLITLYRLGDTGGKIAVFLPGWRSQGSVWFPLMQALAIDGIGSVSIDLSGFGASPASKESMSVQNYADIVLELLEKLHLQDVTLVGHSFGGRVAIVCAAKHTPFVSRLVLVDSAGFVNRLPFFSFFLPIARVLFAPSYMQGLRRFIYRLLGAEDYIATPELTETFKRVIAEDLTNEMKKINIPTLLVWGQNDQDTPMSYAHRMQKLIPNSQLVLLPRAGHFSFVDDTKSVNTVLRHFVIPQ